MVSAVWPRDWVDQDGEQNTLLGPGVGDVKGEKPTAQLLRGHNQMGDIGQATE